MYKIPKYPQIKNISEFNKLSTQLCGDFEKTLYQYFVANYISKRTPYKSMLLYHAVGVGKTCSAITLAEGFLTSHSIYEEPMIWVIMPLALKNSFKEQIFSIANYENYEYLANQCTGDLYIKMAQILRDTNKERAVTNIKKLMRTRYKLFTYDAFATFIETEYISKNRTVKDKVIIVDEAHNIRSTTLSSTSSTSSENSEKRVYTSLVNVLEEGVNNRLVLLSATPMYNKPDDIFDLLYLLCLNDNQTQILNQPFPSLFNEKNIMNNKAVSIVKQLSSVYISYLKGKNPFTFALKISPKYLKSLNIQFLSIEPSSDSNNKPIPATYKGWLSEVEDGIVTSPLSTKQLEYIARQNAGDDNNVFNNLQPMNIVYDDSIGQNGFNTFFTRTTNDNAGINVQYNKNYNNALYPSDEYLGQYSGKFLNICNIVRNSRGIVVIYSGYIWSGIIPMAACLEHMGFVREGTNNILSDPEIIPDAPRYGHKASPKYCILSSENSEVMGNTSIDNLLKTINSPKNIDGSQIKVILITPVAGEGLSFYNVREMHIMEPWFHFNRLTQIIGRGIRNCRHQSLPLHERNVTVFMHASSFNKDQSDRETTDIHAFRISSKKWIQSKAIDNIIRNNAIDCTLMQNINYFPKSIFELGKIMLLTSQNVEIDYEYGDDISLQPQCNYELSEKDIIDTGFRREAYQHFILPLQNKIRKLVLVAIQNNKRYLTFDEIVATIDFDKEVIYDAINSSIYPNILIEGYILIPHQSGLHIININPERSNLLRISYKQDDEKPVASKCSVNFKKLSNKSSEEATLAIYLSMTSSCFTELVKGFVENKELSATDEIIATSLYSQGGLIARSELPNIVTGSDGKYIGYVNIFDKSFQPIIYVNGKYRDLIERENAELISKRRKIEMPKDMSQDTISWGVITPVLDKKTNEYSNVFKLLTAGSSVGTKTGIVCSSLQKQAQEAVLAQLGITTGFSTKVENCHNIALEMMKSNRLTIFPQYKPI